MTGRARRSARGPRALPWRTALLVGALALLLWQGRRPAEVPLASDQHLGYDPGALRVVLGGVVTTPEQVAPPAASGPEEHVRDMAEAVPDAGDLVTEPAVPTVQPAGPLSTTPASFAGQ